MCTTCGCDTDREIKLLIPGEIHHDHPHLNHDHHHVHDHNHLNGHEHPHHLHESKKITLEQDIMGKNNLMAERNRGYFEAKNILAINIVSSPGSGKTTVLEKSLPQLMENYKVYIIEGDQQTTNDAERIQKTGASVVQINTGQGCHLDADMVHKAVNKLNPCENSILFIENVGNLVCPGLFDLGESYRTVIISVTEGEDKPLKYPVMFQSSQLCLINKTDLLPYVSFDMNKAREYALRVNKQLELQEICATEKGGLESWITWIDQIMNEKLKKNENLASTH